SFRPEIDAAIADCDVVLVLVGNDWLVANPPTQPRYFNDPTDSVRLEIESAIRRQVPILPILVGSARLPRETDLPHSVASLIACRTLKVRFDRDLQGELQQLPKALDGHFVTREKKRSTTPAQHESDPQSLAKPSAADRAHGGANEHNLRAVSINGPPPTF